MGVAFGAIGSAKTATFETARYKKNLLIQIFVKRIQLQLYLSCKILI